MNISSKRAEYVSLTGAVLSVVFFAASLVISGLSRAYAVSFLGWQFLGGGIIWLVLTVVFHQRSLAEREKRDMVLAENDRVSDTIFQSSSNRQAVFTAAQRQLEVMEKYFMPVFSVIIAAYHIVIGWLCFVKYTSPARLEEDLNNALLYSIFVALIAFVSFLFSRYATGLSADENFKPLRGGGSILLASSLLSFFVWISLAFGHFKFSLGLTILGYAIPILMIFLGVETALNLVMDVYRPRTKGQHARAAFDGRLLGAINEPGGILHSFSSALDYQFGFKVSQTWFVKLLGKAIIPLVMVGILAMYSLSCFIIVAPGEQAVIEHFGSFDRIAESGLNCKLPWPFEKSYKYSTSLVQQINIGFVEKEDEDDGEVKAFVWGEKHYDVEFGLLVAASSDIAYEEGEGGTVPVSLVIAAIPVQYIVNDLEAFLYNNTDSKAMLEAICYRQVTQYAARSTVETGGDSESILGVGRKQAAEDLKAGIQKEANEFGLGVEIVFLGLQGVHPPVEVAKAFQDVTGAVQEKQAVIMEAEALRNEILSTLAGSIEESNRLYDMVAGRDKGKAAGNELKEALSQASGDVAKILNDASGYAFEKAALAKAAGERFQSQVKAFEASPTIYTQLLRIEMLEETLRGIRKYVILTESDDTEIYILDLQEKSAPSLYDMELETFKN